jgi:hypothetical protein
MAGWLAKCEHVASALKGIPGIQVEVAEARPELDEAATTSPRTHIFFEKSWKGPSEREVAQMLRDGDPSIRVGSAGYYGGISIIPVNLQDGEEELIARRLKEILKSRR